MNKELPKSLQDLVAYVERMEAAIGRAIAARRKEIVSELQSRGLYPLPQSKAPATEQLSQSSKSDGSLDSPLGIGGEKGISQTPNIQPEQSTASPANLDACELTSELVQDHPYIVSFHNCTFNVNMEKGGES